jgi:methyltransferase
VLSAFFVLVGLVAAMRLVELGISQRHRRELVRLGARPVTETGFGVMVALHAGILAGSILEVLLARRSVPLALAAGASIGVVAANVLRIWAIRTLGRHWNVRVVDSTALGVVGSGPYRFIRHPNYVAVFLELSCLPLVQGAWITAVVGTLLHVLVLRRRIALEEAVLFADERYAAIMRDKPRFWPRIFRRSAELVGAERL